MNSRTGQQFVTLMIVSCAVLFPLDVNAADSGDVRNHAEQSFERLKQQGAYKDTIKRLEHHVSPLRIGAAIHQISTWSAKVRVIWPRVRSFASACRNSLPELIWPSRSGFS